MAQLTRRAIPGRGELWLAASPEELAAAAAADLVRAAGAVAPASDPITPRASRARRAPGAPRALEIAPDAPAAASRGASRFALVLAGGSTPRSLYRLLVDPAAPYRAATDWRRIHFFWGDERHVPPDHPESNYRMAREALLDPLAVPRESVHRIPAELPEAAAAAAEYESELRAFFALSADGAHLPRFDYVLLGLGEEGHTASLFPGSPALGETRRLVVAPWVEAKRSFRITLTPPALSNAKRITFLVAGESKAAALHEVLEGERRPERYPAQAIEPRGGGTLVWLVDRAAASRLTLLAKEGGAT
jgi:6-phosphogluconolactonase